MSSSLFAGKWRWLGGGGELGKCHQKELTNFVIKSTVVEKNESFTEC